MIPVLIINDTRVDRHHGCNRVMGAILALLERNGMAPILLWPAHRDWQDDPAFAEALARARLVVVNGEGTIHHDRPAGRRLLSIAAEARARGIPAALVNCGWEANGAELTDMLSGFALLSARDQESARQMRESGASVAVVPDLSLHGAVAAGADARRGIGFTDNVERLCALALDAARRACGGATVAITWGDDHARFLREGLSLRQDLLHPLRLGALLRMRQALWQASTSDTGAFLGRLGALQLLVSGRFHACTLALAAATPFFALASNTTKSANLIADAGLEPWRNLASADPAAIREAARAGWSEHEHAARRAYLNAARNGAEALFAELRKLAA